MPARSSNAVPRRWHGLERVALVFDRGQHDMTADGGNEFATLDDAPELAALRIQEIEQDFRRTFIRLILPSIRRRRT